MCVWPSVFSLFLEYTVCCMSVASMNHLAAIQMHGTGADVNALTLLCNCERQITYELTNLRTTDIETYSKCHKLITCCFPY